MKFIKNFTGFGILSAGILLTASFSCGKIAVTANTNVMNNNTARNITQLSVNRGDAEAVNTKRLYSYEGAASGSTGMTPAAQLKVEITGKPNNLRESYHYLQFFSDPNEFRQGTSHNKSFIENNSGSLFYLSQTQQNGSSETTGNGDKHIGSGKLFIIQENDRFVPWRINRDTAGTRCFPMGGNDCLDMETFTRLLFEALINNVESSIESQAGSPKVIRQELRYIPQIIHEGFEQNNRRARGFGLVYFTEVDYFTGKVFVYLPMRFVFLDNASDYDLFIDPLDNATANERQSSIAKSIYVKGEFFSGIAEGLLRDKIDTIIKNMPSINLIRGINNGTILMTGFNTASGQTTAQAASFRTSPLYEIMLVPENRTVGIKSNVLWRKKNDDGIENVEKVSLFFLE